MPADLAAQRRRARLMPDAAELLIVVRPGADERFRLLEETFTGLPVRVMWDRRQGERRNRSRAHGAPDERRQAERRGRAQVIGHALDWVIVREPASARAREAASQPD